ncbi:penicillin acylase family protein [Acuticoccus sp.]|uniref:penicillin acylase family protein n=1 Tax=Acuticoccus sp. TaxID=1904378 RepID=UPI003B520068
MKPSSLSKIGRRSRQAFGLAGLASGVLRRSLGRRFPATTLADRLAMLPTAAPLQSPLTIRWNDHHVPFVEAGCDRDAAVGLGIVHGHLRLAQMELMRRAALGRVSEVAGDAALELDRLLRLIDFPRVTEASLALMPDATRAWIAGFSDGINAAGAARRPPEFDVLGIEFEPWSEADLFAVSRLCSADYAWKVWRTLNPLREDPEWARMWADLIGVAAVADEDIPIGADNLEDALPHVFDRAGSNCLALAGSRTASGAPMLACDPHHIITAPNLWLIAGFRTPDLAVWGFMIPALPIFGVGRNAHGAWGGTNLHATSSELVNVSGEAIDEVPVSIRTRGRTRSVTTRQSRLGPIISDARPFRMRQDTVALHWLGHRPSDEFTPFRDMMRATSWEEFAASVDGYALPGLNMLWAGASGRIGKMIGAHVPSRPLATPDDLVITPDAAHTQWTRMVTGRDLPMTVDPEAGFVVSSNEAPEDPPVTISLFFASDLRFRRIGDLLGARRDHTVADMRRLHQDVHHEAAHDIAQRVARVAAEVGLGGPVIEAIAGWDGDYAAGSAGALAFELLAEPLVKALEARSEKRFVSPYWRPFSRLTLLVGAAPDEELSEVLAEAARSAEKPFARHKTWGDMHRVRLAHPFARLPWMSARLPTLDFPSGGSNDTVMKSMHPFTQRRHATNFGANARFIADLSGEDETYALLLGGQDGWPGSRTMFDMVGAWRRGEALRLPFSRTGLDSEFTNVTKVEPSAAARVAAHV